MRQHRPISQLPWQVTTGEFIEAAAGVGEAGACCTFLIDDSIPEAARSGYAALVIAYARADEPVCIEDDGTAILLVREGGVTAGKVVATRILDQMRRLSLDGTLRAGVVPLRADAAAVIRESRSAASAANAGSVNA